MNSILPKSIGLLAVVFLGWLIYYGNYLPLVKSEAFISALSSARELASFDEFKSTMSAALDLPSPIGQEEHVRNTANLSLNIISSTDDPNLIAQVVQFIDGYYEPIVRRGTGMSFGQNMYILGALYETAFLKTKNPQYFERAKFYYEKGLELGPKRPQPLYGLFDIYRLEGNVEGARKVADQILSQWPEDERTKVGLEEFLKRVDEFKSKK